MRVVAFSIISMVALFTPLWMLVLCAVPYAFWRRGYELIVVGAFIDAQFGTLEFPEGYMYTLLLGGIVLCAEFFKPHLAFYNA